MNTCMPRLATHALVPLAAPAPEDRAAIERFLTHVEVELGLAANTVMAYRGDLGAFAGFLRERLGSALAVATPEHLGRYLEFAQAERKLEISSILRQVAAIKMFYKFALAHGGAQQNPTEFLDKPHHWKKLPDVLSRETVDALFAAVARESKLARRDLAIMELFYASGLRASEMADLRLSDLHLELGVMRVMGKGRKERIVPVHARAIAALQRYLDESRPQLMAVKTTRAKAPADRVFVSRSGGPITRVVLWQMVVKYSQAAGIRRIHPHTLRHTFATHLLAGGADLRVVQELLGHADVTTTQIYTHVDADRLKSVHRKHHPRQ